MDLLYRYMKLEKEKKNKSEKITTSIFIFSSFYLSFDVISFTLYQKYFLKDKIGNRTYLYLQFHEQMRHEKKLAKIETKNVLYIHEFRTEVLLNFMCPIKLFYYQVSSKALIYKQFDNDFVIYYD